MIDLVQRGPFSIKQHAVFFFPLYSSHLKITNWWLWKHSEALGVAGVPQSEVGVVELTLAWALIGSVRGCEEQGRSTHAREAGAPGGSPHPGDHQTWLTDS